MSHRSMLALLAAVVLSVTTKPSQAFLQQPTTLMPRVQLSKASWYVDEASEIGKLGSESIDLTP